MLFFSPHLSLLTLSCWVYFVFIWRGGKKNLAIPQSRQLRITLNWKQSSIIVQNVLHLHPNFTLIYFCSLLCVCFIDFYFYFFAGCNQIVTTKICERSVKYKLAFETGHQMMKPDIQILQWPVNFEWVKNSCTLERVYKHNNAERSVAVHWRQSTKVVAQTDCTIWRREFLENWLFSFR